MASGVYSKLNEGVDFDNLIIPFCRTVVVLEASAQVAQEDRTRVAPNPLMGVLTGAPTEERQKAALPLPPEVHLALGPQ